MVLSELALPDPPHRALCRGPGVSPRPWPSSPPAAISQALPLRRVLIMSPWNYPLLLTLDPLVDALAAGNTAVVKPSAYSPATSQSSDELLAECFPPEYVAVVTGGREENAALLDRTFDYIFFTGSQAVGREVLRHAAEHLTPVTLELGGKSPCIVDDTADLDAGRPAHRLWKIPQLRPDLRGAGLYSLREASRTPLLAEHQTGRSPSVRRPAPGKSQTTGRSSTKSTLTGCWG